MRKFGAYTGDLQALAEWLTACGVTTVAMESTGVYWIPLYRVLLYGQEYVRQSEEAYEAAYQERLVKSMAKNAARLGNQLVPTPTRS